MRLHPNLYRAIVTTVSSIFEQGELADKAVPNLLRSNRQWGSKDRRLLAGSIYDIVRYMRLYAFAIETTSTPEQIDWEKVFLAWAVDKEVDLPDWIETTPSDIEEIKKRLSEGRTKRVIRESIPDWIDELGHEQLGIFGKRS